MNSITIKRQAKRITGNVLYYLVLFSLSFVFLYPLLYMISQSLMRVQDVADATVQWIPKHFDFFNYVIAFNEIRYWNGFVNSVIISVGSAVLQILSCSIIGYGFARYRFPGQAFWLALVVFTFLVPPQTIVVPLYIFFSDLGWINTHMPFIFPALFGHGLKGALFVLIFIQFYRRLPAVLEEAARIDGAGPFRTYWTIMFPLAKPAMLVVFLFSVVWHWNDLFEPSTYLMVPEFFNLAQNMAVFNGNANAEMGQMAQQTTADTFGMAPTIQNQIMAAVLLTILPVLILYLFVQRHFVESVERAGIAGE
ncbi:carbohydrate ABC transporter permease [Paenibacillus alkalitolerans]|uniref:carbohydrate ABC transporter permease n=1 Tax=Paenibacillus alkalitolerans TaxID=2799335 RepID=UPI0018F42A85|nr:carbohydrate ABC transporter permease [Paenibacillus alkalitolerans]